MDNLRILFFISSLVCGGAEHHLLNLCRYLISDSNRVAVCVVSGKGDELESLFRDSGIDLVHLELESLLQLTIPSRLKRLRDIAAIDDFDLIHAHLYHAEMTAQAASRISGLPLVVTRHSVGLEFNGVRRILTRMAAGGIDRLIAVSRQSADEASALGVDESRISVVENGVDTSRFRPLPADRLLERKERILRKWFGADVSAETVIVGSLGGLKPVKDYGLFIDMAGRIFDDPEIPEDKAVFVIMGDGPERGHLEKMVREKGLEAVVSLPGWVDFPEDALPVMDVFVLPSLTEGVPVALLEAMSCGLACVASRVGGIPSIAGDSCILVESGDLSGFAREVKSLVMDSDLRRKYGSESRLRAVRSYDLAAWGAKIEDIYRDTGRVRKRRS